MRLELILLRIEVEFSGKFDVTKFVYNLRVYMD